MRYSAASLTHAAQPITLSIGRASSRRGWRWLSQQWVKRCRSWVVPPLSAPQMLALQAVRGDDFRSLVALAGMLRVLIPRRWWHRLTGDPVRLLLRLPPDLLRLVLSELVAIPGTGEDGTEDENPIEQLRRLQRRAVYGDAGAMGPVPTLAVATLTVQTALGHGWYYQPGVWPTTDGFAPFGVVWVQYVGLQALAAKRVLERADAYAMSQAKEPQRVRTQLIQAAFPQEVC